VRPVLPALALVVGLAAAADISLSLTSSPAAAQTVDAGVAPGITATSPALTTPAPKDVISEPAAAFAEAQATYQRSGMWAGILFGLWALMNAIAKRKGPGTMLGDGRLATGMSGGAATLGAVFDAAFNHAPNGVFVVATTMMIAIAAVLTPHVTHKTDVPAS
jgi:hypothetical protein